jgi:hypothetical protein
LKVAAITPQFVYETPAGDDTVRAEKINDRLHLKSTRIESADDSSPDRGPQEDLDQETREGLKRLLKLVKKSSHEATTKLDERGDAKSQSSPVVGISAYRSLLRFDDRMRARGALINIKC